LGEPRDGYPWSWSVAPWLLGENATIDRITDPARLATELARFIHALQHIDASNGPRSGSHNVSRGVPLAERDASTRADIASLRGVIDTDAATAVWEAAVNVPVWAGLPVWIHGDLQSGNLLAVDGQLNAVIDFGCLGVGDPGCDLMPAWNLFDRDARKVFRAAMDVDDATWARGRGWALSCGVGQLSFYMTTNPLLAGIGRFTVNEVLAEHERGEL
jgi:aminoglycoside phosphotransferase (APT) family kinase protein